MYKDLNSHYLNLPSKRISKIIFVFLILIILDLIFGGWYLWLKNIDKNKKTYNPPFDENINIVEQNRAINLELAKSTLNWLDKQRDENGIYTLSKSCKNTNIEDCDKFTKSNRTGFPVLWSRFKYYEATKDKAEMEILRNDIYNYANRNVVQLIQNNFYDCYFIYDLWKSDFFTKEEKDKLEKICFDGQYELTPDYLSKIVTIKNEEITKETDSFKPIVESKLKNILNNETLLTNIDKNNLNILINYPYFVSDFVTRYEWNKKPIDLYSAYLIYDNNLDYFLNKKNPTDSAFSCATGLASLSMSEIDNNENYLNVAKKIFDSEFNKNKNLKDIAICTLLADKLGKYDKKYIIYKNNFLNVIVNKYFDQKPYSGEVNGDGGFNERGSEIFIKNVSINGVISGMLSYE